MSVRITKTSLGTKGDSHSVTINIALPGLDDAVSTGINYCLLVVGAFDIEIKRKWFCICICDRTNCHAAA